MINQKQMKYENPVRLAELNPEDTLRRIGLGQDDVLCDMACDTGTRFYRALRRWT